MHDTSQVYYGIKNYDSYGLGWMNDKINTVEMDGEFFLQPLQGHSGSVYGFNSLMFFNQDVKLGVILFVNQGFHFVPEALHASDEYETQDQHSTQSRSHHSTSLISSRRSRNSSGVMPSTKVRSGIILRSTRGPRPSRFRVRIVSLPLHNLNKVSTLITV